jgi:hypothetical protein
MHPRSRTRLAWLVFGATFACLVGGLVVTLFVTRPLTAQVLVNGAFEGPSGCCSPPSGWS